jgi:hypothetical protein
LEGWGARMRNQFFVLFMRNDTGWWHFRYLLLTPQMRVWLSLYTTQINKIDIVFYIRHSNLPTIAPWESPNSNCVYSTAVMTTAEVLICCPYTTVNHLNTCLIFINKKKRNQIPKEQSRMDSQETLPSLGTQDTRRRQIKSKYTTQQGNENNEQYGYHQTGGKIQVFAKSKRFLPHIRNVKISDYRN